jgi:hypothetical protein
MFMCVYIDVYLSTRICIFIYACSFELCIQAVFEHGQWKECICTYTYVQVCIYIDVYLSTRICIFIYAYTFELCIEAVIEQVQWKACMYVNTYLCRYICILT